MLFLYDIGRDKTLRIGVLPPLNREGYQDVTIYESEEVEPVTRVLYRDAKGKYFSYKSNKVYLKDYNKMRLIEAYYRLLSLTDITLDNLLLAMVSTGESNFELVDNQNNKRFVVDLYETIKCHNGCQIFTQEIVKDDIRIPGPVLTTGSLYNSILNRQLTPVLTQGAGSDYSDEFWEDW